MAEAIEMRLAIQIHMYGLVYFCYQIYPPIYPLIFVFVLCVVSP